MIAINKSKLPKNIWPIVDEVKNTFDSFKKKIYTIDFMFDENEIPWIVKLNSMLRLYFSSEQKDEMTKTFLTIINLFKK
jgi:hypothetical protein